MAWFVFLSASRNWNTNRKENFCKETLVSKITTGAKVNHPCRTIKKSTGFFPLSVIVIYCDLVALLRDNMLMGALLRDKMLMGVSTLFIITYIIYNWLLNMCTLKTCYMIVISMFHFWKNLSLFSVFFISYWLISLHASQPTGQPNAEDTYQPNNNDSIYNKG